MGKQSRRNRRAAAAKNKRFDPTGSSLAAEKIAAVAVANTTNPALVEKLRHADVKVRHSTLSALATTVFDCDALEAVGSPQVGDEKKKKKKKLLTHDLVRLVAERIMDEDVYCATCAAGCISNYTSFYYQNRWDTINEEDEAVERSITPILFHRLDRSCRGIHTLLSQWEAAEAAATREDKTAAVAATTPVSCANVSKVAENATPVMMDEEEEGGEDADAEGNTSPNKTKKKKKKKKKRGGKGKGGGGGGGGHATMGGDVHKLSLKLVEEWNLVALCASCLCGLVEERNNCVERLSSTATTTTTLDNTNHLLQTLLGVLSLGTRALSAYGNASAATTAATFSAMDHNAQETVPCPPPTPREATATAMTHAARTLHAALDENPTLVAAFLSDSQTQGRLVTPVTDMQHLVCPTTMPPLVRLHAVGILATVRHAAAAANNNQSLVVPLLDGWLAQKSGALEVLAQYLHHDAEHCRGLIQRLRTTARAVADERNDAEMEQRAIQQVDSRGESARLIARRQKAMRDNGYRPSYEEKEDGQATKGGDDDEAMEMDNDNDDDVKQDDESPPPPPVARTVNVLDAHEWAICTWQDTCARPLVLALEVTTNLCAAGSASAPVLEDDEMVWDSDKEENWVPQQQEEEASLSTSDVALLASVAAAGIPNKVVTLLDSLRQSMAFLSTTRTTTTMEQKDENHKDTHDDDDDDSIATGDWKDAMEKWSACLCNMLANMENFVASGDESLALWNKLCHKDQPPPFSSLWMAHQAAVTNVMVALWKFRPSLFRRRLLGPDDLHLLLQWASSTMPPQDDNGDTVGQQNDVVVVVVVQNATRLLGFWCAEPHEEAVNEAVCEVLLRLLLQEDCPPTILNEVLNVLMDMYSADEGEAHNHHRVFVSRHVLAAFQQAVPRLKRYIDAAQDHHQDQEVLHLWKETALNATRFIKYKQERK